MQAARRLLGMLLWPLRRVLDPRFHDVTHRIASAQHELQVIHAAVDDVSQRVDQTVGTSVAAHVEALTFLGQELRRTAGETNDELRALRAEMGTRAYVDRLDSLSRHGQIDDLDGAAAALINHALSHEGFAAQAELWMNPPLVLAHAEGTVRLSVVNERIVEIPFAMRALGQVPIGGRVLDFGSSESPVALELASIGYRTTALDFRAYPFSHPNLESVAMRLEEWDGEPGSFDAVLAISTVEHVGLGWYGEARGAADADRRAVQQLAGLLVPGGLLVLTVPFGTRSVDAMQRRYDNEKLDQLLEGLEVEERLIVEQTDHVTWTPVTDSRDSAVALVTARTPAP